MAIMGENLHIVVCWDEINRERSQLVRAVADIAHRQSPLPKDIDTV
ncbi:MAG: hypothetical protein JXB42_11205 [Deltaproteobacteria bacterium]|nr:hypothetical protein [Deltaproteobacteria bacterium]